MGDQASGLLSPWLRARRLAAVRAHLRGRVLDYGCGTGLLADSIAPDQYAGLDIDPQTLVKAREIHPGHRFASDLATIEGDFDTVVMLALIEHVPEPAAVMRAVGERLRPGGRVVLTTPHPSVRSVHELGARVGIFSRGAADEHEDLLDRRALRAAMEAAGLRLVSYRRFLVGANQLVIGMRRDVVRA